MACVSYNVKNLVTFCPGLCIKVGRGHQDACVGTWDLWTRDEGLEDSKYGTWGRVGWGCGDVKYRDAAGGRGM